MLDMRIHWFRHPDTADGIQLQAMRIPESHRLQRSRRITSDGPRRRKRRRAGETHRLETALSQPKRRRRTRTNRRARPSTCS